MVEQVNLLQGLTEHPGWQVLTDWLNERMRPRKLEILNGNIKSHEDYLKSTWFCVGATEAIDAPQKVAQLLVNEQERRENAKG